MQEETRSAALCPVIPKDLVEYLNRTFPERCPDFKDTEREIWFYKGQREIVKWLMYTQKSQEDKQYGYPLKIC